MSETNLSIPLDRLIEVAVEHWRLSTLLAEGGNVPVNYALRKLGDFLQTCHLETRGLDGQPYDAGLAARVVDTIDDPALDANSARIVQTISPLVLYQGTVVRSAEVVIAKRPG